MLAVARPLQAAIDAKVKAGANSKGRVLDESAGNFNAKAIEALLDTRGYACTRLSLRLGEAPSGKPRALIKHLCSNIGERACGVIWRLGEVCEDGVATAGHWLGATYEHSKEPLAQRRWFEKDSLASKKATAISFEALLVTIDSVERDHRDFLVIVGLVE